MPKKKIKTFHGKLRERLDTKPMDRDDEHESQLLSSILLMEIPIQGPSSSEQYGGASFWYRPEGSHFLNMPTNFMPNKTFLLMSKSGTNELIVKTVHHVVQRSFKRYTQSVQPLSHALVFIWTKYPEALVPTNPKSYRLLAKSFSKCTSSN